MVIINGEQYGGLLPECPAESDWTMGGVVDRKDIPNPPHSFPTEKIQFNQNEYKHSTCTMYASMGAYCDLMGERLSFAERKDLIDKAIQEGLSVTEGWYINKAIALVGKELGVSYVKVETNSDDFREAINRGFSLATGYQGSKAFNVDRDDDKIVQGNDRGTPTYGHAIRFCSIKKQGDLYIIDNYDGRPSNVFSFPELQEKIKNGKLFSWAYFYFSKITLPMANLPEHLSKDAVTSYRRREIIIAWENEISKWLNDGGDINKLFHNYLADTAEDEADVICRMEIDLKFARSGLL